MKKTASKEKNPTSRSSEPFFSKTGEGGFFAPTQKAEQPFFARDISQQGDVDAMADQVMRMSHTEQQEHGVQHKVGDEHDLRSLRFKGDTILESVFDRKQFVRRGAVGKHVQKIQSALVDLNFSLPKFGVDGTLGSETENALRSFQSANDLVADGVIGTLTIGALDEQSLPLPPPPVPICPGKDAVDNTFQSAAFALEGDNEPQPCLDPPGPNPTDECNLECNPISTLTKRFNNNKSKITFGLCNDAFDSFEAGAGSIDNPQGGCLPFNSNTQSILRFKLAGNKPAWQLTPKVPFCLTPDANPPKAPFEIGLSQTLESAVFGAKYDNNNFIEITNSKARDALSANAASPWFDIAGSPFGPQQIDTQPTLTDTPNVSFPIAHPDNKTTLNSVCMKGKFNLFLIVKEKATSNVDFLHHWTINFNKQFFLQRDPESKERPHPCSISAWMRTGSQTKSSGLGRGTDLFIPDKPIANGNQTRDDKKTSDPC